MLDWSGALKNVQFFVVEKTTYVHQLIRKHLTHYLFVYENSHIGQYHNKGGS